MAGAVASIHPGDWAAPRQGPAHTQGARAGLGEHHFRSSPHQVPQPRAASSTTALARAGETGWVCGGSHVPVRAAAQAASPPCPFPGQLGCGAGSCAAGRRAEGHEPGPGMLSPVSQCRQRSQPHGSETARAAPLPLRWARSGRGLPCPPSSQNDSAEAAQCFSSAVLWPEHPHVGPQLIRPREGSAEPGRMQCSRGPGSSASPIRLCLSHPDAAATAPTHRGRGRMGAASLSFSYPGDGERHAEVLPSLQPEAPGRRPVQHHLVGLHVTHLCKGRGRDPGIRVHGNRQGQQTRRGPGAWQDGAGGDRSRFQQ